MECRETRPRLSAMVDGELSPAEQAEVERHLAECAGCRARLARERELKSLLRTKISPAATPPEVRARLMAALDGEDMLPERARRPIWSRIASFWEMPRYALIAGTAALAILAISLLPRGGGETTIPLNEVAAHFAQASAGQMKLEMRTSDIDALRAFYRRSGHFAFEDTAEDFSGKGLQLVGGSLSHLGRHTVTMSLYEGPLGKMLCHRFRAEQVRLPEGGESVGTTRIYSVGGIAIAVLRLGHGVVCILATNMPKQAFLRVLGAA